MLGKQKALPLHRNYEKAIAQMAESVDALVSNTSGATHPGSIPGLGTEKEDFYKSSFFYAIKINCFAKSRIMFIFVIKHEYKPFKAHCKNISHRRQSRIQKIEIKTICKQHIIR